MPRRRLTLTLLLLALLQVGMLPVSAGQRGEAGQFGLGRQAEAQDCACACEAESIEACCCCSEEKPAGSENEDGCDCGIERSIPALPTLPPQPRSARGELDQTSLHLATPCPRLNGAVPSTDLLPERIWRPSARAGPPLYRLYAVDRR